MTKWTRKEEQQLWKLYQTARSYREIADALGRSVGSVTGKLHRLQKERKKAQAPIYTKSFLRPRTTVPKATEIHDQLVSALLKEFNTIHQTLATLGRKDLKHKRGLHNNLCRIAEVLISLLKTKPEKPSMETWWDQLDAEQLPRHARRVTQRLFTQWTTKRNRSL